MPKAVPYIRFSSSKQEKGDSLKRQQDLIDKYLIKNPELELSSMRFQDLGLSAFKGHHLDNEFGQLLDAVEEGYIKAGDYILVEAMDRLGRIENVSMVHILTGILMKDVKIVTLEDGQEYSREAMAENQGIGYVLWGKCHAAYEYSLRLSKRIKASYDTKRREAQQGKGVKRKTPWWITWSDTTERYDAITDTDKELMTNLYRWYMDGLGERRILTKLRELDSERFLKFNAASVKLWLKNKTAIGYWGDIAQVYPMAVSEALFYQVQQEIARRADGKSQSSKSGYYLCGLVVCNECGGNYAMKAQKHSTPVMICGTANHDKAKCTNGKTLPTQLLDLIRNYTFTEAIQNIETRNTSKEAIQELAVVEGKITELETKLDNLLELVAGGSKRTQAKVILLEANLEDLESEREDLLIKTITPDRVSEVDAILIGDDMLDEPDKLNKALKGVGYKLHCSGHTITYKNRCWKYVKWSRKNDCYHLEEYLNSDLVSTEAIPVHRIHKVLDSIREAKPTKNVTFISRDGVIGDTYTLN